MAWKPLKAHSGCLPFSQALMKEMKNVVSGTMPYHRNASSTSRALEPVAAASL